MKKSAPTLSKEDKLAAKLRENLKRRKAQAKQRSANAKTANAKAASAKTASE